MTTNDQVTELRNIPSERAATQPAGAPVAWMTEDGRVATAETKNTAMPRQSAVNFNIPLYLAAPISEDTAKPEASAATQQADEDRCLKMMILVEDYMSAVDYHGGQNGAKCDAAIEAIGTYLRQIAAPPISEDTDEVPISRSTFGTKEECEAEQARRAARTPASVGSIAPQRPNDILLPEDDEFLDLMKEWRFADVGDASRKAFDAVVVYIHRWADSRIAAAPERSGKAADESDAVVRAIIEAGDHLRAVMVEHPHCDHVQVVKHYADIKLKAMRAAAPAGNSSAAPSEACQFDGYGCGEKGPYCAKCTSCFNPATPAPTGESLSVPSDLSTRLRDAVQKLRRTPQPVKDIVPMLQQAADEIDRLAAKESA